MYSGIAQLKYLFLTFIVSSFLLATPLLTQAQTANECAFSRTLEMGMAGEDIRCLQQFLNKSGFEIAETGPGAPGHETSLFRTLTKAAVVKWQQANDVSPASGVFGPVSQAAYLLDLIDDLESTAANQTAATKPAPQPVVAGAATSLKIEATKSLINALSKVQDAEEEIEDFTGNQTEREYLETDLRDVRFDFYRALQSFFDQDYSEVEGFIKFVANDAANISNDAQRRSGSDSAKTSKADKDSADQAIYDAWDAFDNADQKVDVAEDDDERGWENARDLLDQARELLYDAEDAFAEKDWSDAARWSEEAEDLIDDASDEL